MSANTFSLLSILFFSLFGRDRLMDSVSVIIGSGLILFLILLTLLFLIKTFETQKDELAKRCFFIGVSSLAYLLLILSYEIAFPVLMVVLITSYFFQPSKKSLKEFFKSRLYLLLYLVPLLGYFVHYKFYTNLKNNYKGAEIVWSLDILTRLNTYLSYTLVLPAKLHLPTIEELAVLLLYFIAIYLSLKTEDLSAGYREKRRRCFKLLIFGTVFYFSTIVLFIINNYLTPYDIMMHHTYLMTAASSILLVFLFLQHTVVLPRVLQEVLFVFLVSSACPFLFVEWSMV